MGSPNVSPARPRDAGRRVRPRPAPSLENGDRVTRAEFERRYEARRDLKKAELIEGVVYMPSPTRSASHARPHATLVGWLFAYVASTPGVQLNDNPTLRLDLDNEPQPDIALLIDPDAGGQARVSEDDYIEGAPEIAASSASYDLHDKLHAYRRNGVREYLVWRTLDRGFDRFELFDGVYRQRQPDASGLVHSQAFPGLRLAVDGLLRGDLSAGVEAQQRGLDDPAHAECARRLLASRRWMRTGNRDNHAGGWPGSDRPVVPAHSGGCR